jgi:transposase
MSTTAPQPATTPIPVQLSEPEFEAFILPHLSMPKRGPKCKLGYYRVFNLILWVLYTGMQWKCLPVPTEPQGKVGTNPYSLKTLRLAVRNVSRFRTAKIGVYSQISVRQSARFRRRE